jgi:tetratricopeptide (TPR) repeat protein
MDSGATLHFSNPVARAPSRPCSSGISGRIVATAFAFLLASFVNARSPAPPDQYDQALNYMQHQQVGPAITLLQQILANAPTDVKAHNLMGIALTASGRLEEANSHFRRALEINPDFYPALKNLAVNELALNRVEEARVHFEEVLRLAPEDQVAHLSLGEIYFGHQLYAAAAQHYLKSGKLLDSDPNVTLRFARSCFESKQGDKATEALENLPQEAGGHAHFQSGVMLAQLLKYAAAAHQFELARKDYPDPYEVGYNLTLAHVRSGNYPAAITTAQGLIAQGHEKAELYNLLSEAYEKNDQTIEAYNALRKATQIDPQDENNYLDLIALGIDHANYPLALGIADIGLRNIPNSYRLLLQRGAVRAFRAQYTEAVEDFEQASRLDPQKDLPYFAMAMALMQTDQMAKGIEILRQRLAASPNDYLILYALGEGLDHLGLARGSPEEKEAIGSLEKSVRLNSGFPDSRRAFGRILLRRGDVDQAIAELEKALELDPTDLSPCYPLASAYRKKGDSQRAAELMAKFERFRAEDREKHSNRTILRLLREGEQ